MRASSTEEQDEALARALQDQYLRDYNASHPAPSAPLRSASSSTIDADEELARRLQRQMRDAEAAQRHSRTGSARRNSTSAPRRSSQQAYASSDADRPASPLQTVRSLRRPSSSRQAFRPRSSGRNLSTNDEDDEFSPTVFARSSTTPHNTSIDTTSAVAAPLRSSTTSPSNNSETPIMVAATPADPLAPYVPPPDVELAMRLEQEERDAALAEQLTRADQEIASRGTVRAATSANRQMALRNERSPCCRRTAMLLIPCVVIIAAIVAVVVVLTGGDVSQIPNIFAGGGGDGDGDPWTGKNPDDVNKWRIKGTGLQLEIVNALEDHWVTLFHTAVREWDAGQPDALSLTTSDFGKPDMLCDPINGKMKVCNGDYGDTRWKGINQVLLSNDWIVSSVAKLNEYYLQKGSEAQRQYTMCHEIGHGFGLPHTDEDFYNKDLGNCMDYTANPEANKSPDESNYEFLHDLYGPVQSRRLNTFEHSNVENNGSGLPESLLGDYESAVYDLEFGDGHACQEWSILHKSKHAESHSCRLNDEFTVQVHMLLATEDDE